LKEGSGNRASVSVGALLGEPGGAFFTGDPEGCVKKGSGDGHLSRWGPRWEPRKAVIYQVLMCRRRLWRWASLSIGARWRTWGGGGSFTGNFEIWVKEDLGNKKSLREPV